MEDPSRFGRCSCSTGQRKKSLASFFSGFDGIESRALEAEKAAEERGFLQAINPRFKVLALLVLIISATASRSLTGIVILFVLAVLLGSLSHVATRRLLHSVWLGILVFSGCMGLPALFLVPGDVLAHLPYLGWSISEQGLRSLGFLVGRSETAATLGLLLILTTPWPHVLKAFSSLGVPVVVIAILGMTYRYIFALLQLSSQLMEARRSRVMAPLSGKERRHMLLVAVGTLLTRTIALGDDVHMAMLSRGYRGEVKLLDNFVTRWQDWAFLFFAVLVLAGILGGLV